MKRDYEVVCRPDNPKEILQKFCRDNYAHSNENVREYMDYLIELDFENIDPQWALNELMVFEG